MATSTFLAICQEVHTKLGFQGELVSAQYATGYQAVIVDLIKTAWRDVQHLREDYFFLRATKSFTITAGTQTYVLYNSGTADIFTLAESQRFGRWRVDKILYNYKPLRYVGYDEWLSQDRSTVVSVPTLFSINPANDSLVFENLSTNAALTLNYIKSAQILSNDTDVPEIPIKDRDVIVWAGVLAGAEQFGNFDARDKATINYEHHLGVFLRHQVPQRTIITPSIA